MGREEGEGVGVDVGEQQSETPLVLPAPCGNVPCCKTKDVWQQSGPFVLQSHNLKTGFYEVEGNLDRPHRGMVRQVGSWIGSWGGVGGRLLRNGWQRLLVHRPPYPGASFVTWLCFSCLRHASLTHST